jgi:hypothetical protein
MASRKAKSHAGRKTRRANSGMTVEALHRSFESIDERVRAMIQRGATDSQLEACISKAWAEHFHSDLGGAAMEGLVKHYRVTHKGKRMTRKRGGQRGGMAPVDYTMGQGTTAPVYGSFISEMGKTPAAIASLDTVNRFFESPISRSCNDTGGAPAPIQRGGAATSPSQRGGSLWAALTTPHAPTSVPSNFAQNVLYGIQTGQSLGPSASPISATAPTVRASLEPYDTTQIHQITKLAPIGSY